MSDYRIAAGHGVALGSLTVLRPQPRATPVRGIQTTYGLTGTRHLMGLYCEWTFGAMVTQTEYAALLTTMGLGSLDEASVTIYTQSERLVYTRYNANIVLPEMGREVDRNRGFIEVTFTLTRLEAL